MKPCKTQSTHKKLSKSVSWTIINLLCVNTAIANEDVLNAPVKNSQDPCLPAFIAQPQKETLARLKKQTIETQAMEADQLSQSEKGVYLLQGNAFFSQSYMVVKSEQALFEQDKNIAKFVDNVELHQEGLMVTAESGTLNTNTNDAQLNKTAFQMLPSRTHGQAKQINMSEAEQQVTLDKANLTTCKIDEQGEKDWDLKFNQLKIDNEKRRVIGYGTTLYFKQVPIFYTPYFDYPLDDRASGLLFPEFGSYKSITDDNSLSYIKIPYYFNIAANMDDTLTVIPIQERGLALDNEFRYLQKTNNITHQANLTLTALNDQVVAKNGLSELDGNTVSFGEKEANRWRLKLNANQLWGNGFSSSINWQAVSDDTFFKEIPVEESNENESLVKRNARLNYQNDNFNAYAEVFGYMRLANAADNYEKRPEFGFNIFQYYQDFVFDVNAVYTDFYTPNKNSALIEGKRMHISPSINFETRNSYSFVKSTLVGNFTQYQYANSSNLPNNIDNNQNRVIPQFALQTGLIFERDVPLFNTNYTQTLEPKIQYLYTPYQDQSDINLFDTANKSLAFSNLFSMNRFSGVDRIGDANQASLAVTSRLLNEEGRETARASIGQIVYFADRKVDLNFNNNHNVDNENESDLFLELAAEQNNWRFASTLKLDKESYKVSDANSRFKIHSKKLNNSSLLVNYALRDALTNDKSDLLSLGGYTEFSNEWELGFYHTENLTKRDYTNSQLGIKYESCCWSTEFIAERTQLENGLYNNGIQIRFELKGLSTGNSSFKNELINQLDF